MNCINVFHCSKFESFNDNLEIVEAFSVPRVEVVVKISSMRKFSSKDDVKRNATHNQNLKLTI